MSEICKNLNHRPSIEKVFYIAILTTCLLGFYLICFGVFEAVYSVVVSVLTFINLLLILYTNTKSKWYYKEIATYLYFLVSISHLPVFFFGSARINFSRRKRDELLVSIDDFLLGWLWEKGQLSLTLDSSPNYNPDTKFHKIFGSILQVFYFIYYIYPYGCIYFIPLAKCIIESIKKYKQELSKQYDRMKSIIAELNMYRNQVEEYKTDNNRIKKENVDLQNKYHELKIRFNRVGA